MHDKYDFLIVGAGLYGAVVAHELKACGKRCLVIDRRSHVAGNAYTENIQGIHVHKFGAHIFHTSNKKVWDYVNHFADFNHYINSPIAIYGDELYNLPFNMNTFAQMWGVRTPAEAKAKIAEQIAELDIAEPHNLEEQALSLVGKDVYTKLIKEYTEKQWGRDCKDLPAFIIKRLPCRFTFDNNYFNDRWQGIPIGGYTAMVERMLEGTEVRLNLEYNGMISSPQAIAEKVIYTGSIDEFFGYRYGELQYRSVRFETQELSTDNYQGNAVVNYTSKEVPWTRIIEHKHFEFGQQPSTIISREYSVEWTRGMEPYYPVNNAENASLYRQYEQAAAELPHIHFGGRLGQYRYYDMDKVIEAALNAVESLI